MGLWVISWSSSGMIDSDNKIDKRIFYFTLCDNHTSETIGVSHCRGLPIASEISWFVKLSMLQPSLPGKKPCKPKFLLLAHRLKPLFYELKKEFKKYDIMVCLESYCAAMKSAKLHKTHPEGWNHLDDSIIETENNKIIDCSGYCTCDKSMIELSMMDDLF